MYVNSKLIQYNIILHTDIGTNGIAFVFRRKVK